MRLTQKYSSGQPRRRVPVTWQDCEWQPQVKVRKGLATAGPTDFHLLQPMSQATQTDLLPAKGRRSFVRTSHGKSTALANGRSRGCACTSECDFTVLSTYPPSLMNSKSWLFRRARRAFTLIELL